MAPEGEHLTAPPAIGTWDAPLFARYRAATSPTLKRALAGKLLQHNMPLIKTVCAQFTGRGEDGESHRTHRSTAATRMSCADFKALEWDDAYQACSLGFMKAVDGFNPAKGKFPFYFTFCARYQLQKLAAELYVIRAPHRKAAERPAVTFAEDQATLDRLGGTIEGSDLAGAEEISTADLAEFERRGQWPESIEEWRGYREAKRERDRSPLDVFLGRVKFSPSARCLTSGLVHAWDRCLSELGAYVPRKTMLDALKDRGVREARVRRDGAVHRGLRGVCLQSVAP